LLFRWGYTSNSRDRVVCLKRSQKKGRGPKEEKKKTQQKKVGQKKKNQKAVSATTQKKLGSKKTQTATPTTGPV